MAAHKHTRTDCGNSGDNLAELEAVKDGSLSGRVETDL